MAADAGDLADFTVHFAAPAPALLPFITSFYQIGIGAEPLDDQLLPEWFNLRLPLSGEWWASYPGRPLFMLPGPLVQGPSTFLSHFGGREGTSFGVGLLPLGWARLFGTDAEPIANRTAPLADHMAADACAALMHGLRAAGDFAGRVDTANSFFTARLAEHPERAEHARIAAIHRALSDPAIGTVGQLADAAGLSEKTLARATRRWLGFPPKTLLRRQRFMRMLGAMHMRPYAEWRQFLDPFYTDQSHMIRDFHDFLGIAPTRYFALPRPIMRAATRLRTQILGGPAQVLHAPRVGSDDVSV